MSYGEIGKYSHSIQFETEVYPGVYWVPLNTLGKSRYTHQAMADMVKWPIQEKKAKIANLYEAVQLFQISGFRGIIDNEQHWIDERAVWEIHKNPTDSVLSNEGCCATDTNWLAYFLHDRYDHLYCFCYCCEDGNGHISTCIEQDSSFYFMDMMMARSDSQAYLCQETGALSDLLNGEWAGFLYRCKDPADFCQFHISRCRAKKRAVPFCFYMRETPYVHATGLKIGEAGLTLLVPPEEKPRVLYCKSERGSRLLSVNPPASL